MNRPLRVLARPTVTSPPGACRVLVPLLRRGGRGGAGAPGASETPPPPPSQGGEKRRPPRARGVRAALFLGVAVLGGLGAAVVAGPESTSSRPAAADPVALETGKALFRGLCTGCHGGAGRGGKGPDLTDDRWIHGGTDADIARVIHDGVPNTTMKKLGESLKDDQIRAVIAYIRSLARSPGESTWKPYLPGDPKAGRALFFDAKGKAQCSKCHSLGGEGGRVGPSLDRIASRRAPEYVMESIVLPSKDIAPEFEAVAVATKGGKVITGLRINETNFTIQLREETGRFHSFLKRDLDEVAVLKKSLMPENFAELLTVKELHDLFAFLMRQE